MQSYVNEYVAIVHVAEFADSDNGVDSVFGFCFRFNLSEQEESLGMGWEMKDSLVSMVTKCHTQ